MEIMGLHKKTKKQFVIIVISILKNSKQFDEKSVTSSSKQSLHNVQAVHADFELVKINFTATFTQHIRGTTI